MNSYSRLLYFVKPYYKRMIFAVFCMIVAAAAAAGFMFMRPVQAQAQIESTAPMEVQSYVVGSGDTLWKYAQIGMKPGDNVNDYVTYLMKLNHLDSADLTPGQRIIVPKH